MVTNGKVVIGCGCRSVDGRVSVTASAEEKTLTVS